MTAAHVSAPAVHARGFVPALEGMRACAAMGVVVTHTAFQTGHNGGVDGRILGRFDLAVAVFFALSGFLLWRPHALAAHDGPAPHSTGRYFASRFVRIVPAYLAAVFVILLLLPDAAGANWVVWAANLTLTQLYVPLTLTAGLTQMWSLAVEVAFYIALPVIALIMRRVPLRWRAPVLVMAGAASLGWAFIPFHTTVGVNPLTWPPAFFSWFVAGMLLAEWSAAPPAWTLRLARRRVLLAVVALVAFAVAASPLAGPEGLTQAPPHQYAVKIAMGATLAWALLLPLTLDTPGMPHRILGSPLMVTLGRWSYGLFIWHLAALNMVFTVIGRFPFSGHFPLVLILTLIFGFAMAAVSYALVESPSREALRRFQKRRTGFREGSRTAEKATVATEISANS
ncbi:acyltransferase family protein [Mycobacteroides chelonae]|uniref:acyltransferase family protein n=1 Tax=Mycobacteroides chelonae TaxID=1774 RepID=UPI0026A00ABA|nr:acyltransferase [Mycobacteroides chelonae]MEC4835481.1 acyltransferase [Mycobacteroides chelonae]MEC4841716.1 acyltransferase [Mycobacteroides chelonae]MEC4846545.1 acyltransferase [Mycobacteroides chelonae]MEC4855662.1 acyltransferase [Mycobacteroides chelonae]MEC4872093.1 acyltransferase [Mycobacteroides chelonae]